jgi:hypothetical protein
MTCLRHQKLLPPVIAGNQEFDQRFKKDHLSEEHTLK